MKKIAVYGKGGIGKSTTTSNLSAALAERGLRVMQIGCDPKADSTKTLMGGRAIPTVLERMREGADSVRLEDIVFEAYGGCLCVESGGPTPGVGCAGRGIIAAFEKLEELEAYERFQPDVILYDVLGDVVCGGFAMPIRGGYADHVLIVTSAEKMALFAASNIACAIESFGKRGYARLAGLIHNSRNIADEDRRVAEAAEALNTTVLKKIPRDGDVQTAENRGCTVIEALPDSPMAAEYRDLAKRVLEVCGG